MTNDFYDLLGVDEDASKEEIRDAFRDMVREYHPDRNDDPRATAQFTAIKKAYDTLKNPSERQSYDRLGHTTYVSKRLDGLPDPNAWPTEDDDGADATNSSDESTSTGSGSTSTGSASGRSATAGTGSSATSSGSSRSTGSRTTGGRTSSSGSTSTSSNSNAGPSSGSSRSTSSASKTRSSGTSSASASNASTSSSSATDGRSNRSASSSGGSTVGDGGTAQAAAAGATASAASGGTARAAAGAASAGAAGSTGSTADGSASLTDNAVVNWFQRALYGWPSIYFSIALYLAGLAYYGYANRSGFAALADALGAAGTDAAALRAAFEGERYGVATGWEYVTSALAGDATAVAGGLFVAGAALMPIVFFLVIWKTRQYAGWDPSYLYVVGVVAPAVGIAANAAVAAGAVASYETVPLAAELLCFGVVPGLAIASLLGRGYVWPRLKALGGD